MHGIGFIESLARSSAIRDRPDGDDRRDRWRRRGASGGLHRRARHEAGRRLHRRVRGAAWQAHGPRRRHRDRVRRARPPPRPKRSKPSGSGWRAPRHRSPSWWSRRSDDRDESPGRAVEGRSADLARARTRRGGAGRGAAASLLAAVAAVAAGSAAALVVNLIGGGLAVVDPAAGRLALHDGGERSLDPDRGLGERRRGSCRCGIVRDPAGRCSRSPRRAVGCWSAPGPRRPRQGLDAPVAGAVAGAMVGAPVRGTLGHRRPVRGAPARDRRRVPSRRHDLPADSRELMFPAVLGDGGGRRGGLHDRGGRDRIGQVCATGWRAFCGPRRSSSSGCSRSRRSDPTGWRATR